MVRRDHKEGLGLEEHLEIQVKLALLDPPVNGVSKVPPVQPVPPEVPELPVQRVQREQQGLQEIEVKMEHRVKRDLLVQVDKPGLLVNQVRKDQQGNLGNQVNLVNLDHLAPAGPQEMRALRGMSVIGGLLGRTVSRARQVPRESGAPLGRLVQRDSRGMLAPQALPETMVNKVKQGTPVRLGHQDSLVNLAPKDSLVQLVP